MVASHTPPAGDLAHNSGMCPDWESNRRLFNSHADTQSSEPHQPRLSALLKSIDLKNSVVDKKLL